MTLVLTLDNNNGMSFLNKRQSFDAAITDRIFKFNHCCWPNSNGVSNTFNKLQWSNIDTVIIFRWNRVYPADRYFKWPADQNFVLSSFENFEGNSHYVTMEVYKRWEK